MAYHHPSFAYFHLHLLLGQVVGEPMNKRQGNSDNIEANKFRRRAFHSVAVLGDYLYIEGGEISSYVNGEKNSQQPSSPVNKTLYIPLNSDWTNDTLQLKEIEHADKMKPVNMLGLWADDRDGGAIYRWAGQYPYLDEVQKDDERGLWKLRTGSDGNGTWSTTRPSNPEVFDKITRTVNGASVACAGLGFHIGGLADKKTDYYEGNFAGDQLPGMLTYTMDSQEWSYATDLGPRPYGTHKRGEALCTTKFGGNPLVFLIGGSDIPSLPSKPQSQQRSFQTLTFLDPVKRSWYEQTIKGPYPPSRDYFCAVAAHGQNGTFEIFIYGGIGSDYAIQDDVWVLTIPGFAWTRAITTGPKRHQHSCALVGESQMISVGGINKANVQNESWIPPDEWRNGIGILDLQTLEWKDHYKSNNPSTYDSPRIVKDFYQQGGLDKVEWSSNEIKAIFVKENSSEENNDHKPPTGVIVGSVIGGIAFLALVMAGLLWLWRRHRRTQAERIITTSELNSDSQRHEISGQELVEKEGTGLAEVEALARHEMGDSSELLELADKMAVNPTPASSHPHSSPGVPPVELAG